MLNRRRFLGTLSASLLVAPLSAEAAGGQSLQLTETTGKRLELLTWPRLFTRRWSRELGRTKRGGVSRPEEPRFSR